MRKLPQNWQAKYAGKYTLFMRVGCPTVVYIHPSAADANADGFYYADGSEISADEAYRYFPNIEVVAKKAGKPIVDIVVSDMVEMVRRGVVTETEAAEQLAPLGKLDEFRRLLNSNGSEVQHYEETEGEVEKPKRRRGRPPKRQPIFEDELVVVTEK